MNLLSISLEGVRRFRERTNVRVAEPLIAFVGPNEAGKSTILDALRLFEESREIPKTYATRRTELSPQIEINYELEDDDISAISASRIVPQIKGCKFRKTSDGKVTVTLVPEPEANIPARQKLVELLDVARKHLQVRGKEKENATKVGSQIPEANNIMKKAGAILQDSDFNKLKSLKSNLKLLSNSLRTEEENAAVNAAIEALTDLLEDPVQVYYREAERILRDRRPPFIFFDQEARELRESYVLGEAVKKPPVSLMNLLGLAEIELTELHQAVKEKDDPLRHELIETANERLKERFSAAWELSDVTPRLDVNDGTLNLFVSIPGKRGYSRIDERSDGLRWFVALISFMHTKDDQERPVLLVDEAEQHLSYDAQANLIKVLEEQRLTCKVLYTTHSAGCLPSDLGTSVRPVIPINDHDQGERSKISNGFWQTHEPGFTPLLLAMGLGPLAFTPARNVVIGEGASECILLPTLMREATALERLPFQVAPGMSQSKDSDFRSLLASAGRVAFVFDGDVSGRKNCDRVRELGAEERQAFSLDQYFDEPLTLEDLLAPEVYVNAFNKVLSRWQVTEHRLSSEDLPAVGRSGVADDWRTQRALGDVNKTEICQELVQIAADGQNLLDVNRTDALCVLTNSLISYFEG